MIKYVLEDTTPKIKKGKSRSDNLH